MNFKKLVIDIDKTIGTLKFGGIREERMGRVRNVRTVVSRDYNLFSDVQREEITVRIPGRVGAKSFAFRGVVDLVNPRLIAEGENINGSGIVDYVIEADDIIAKEAK